jgi:hypothetical protein
MTRPALLAALAVALAAAFVSVPAPARAADDDGFTPLFNGKDLTGWVKPSDPNASFTVENGEIVARTVNLLKKNEFLCTEKDYGDFVLKAKVKFRNGNSGIQFRSKRAPDGAVSGPQADIADGYWGLFYEERRRGILERHDDEVKGLIKERDWNEFVITAQGDHVTIDINGKRIIDRTDPKFDKTGIIGLQIHVWKDPMEVRFKDIMIKPLGKPSL